MIGWLVAYAKYPITHAARKAPKEIKPKSFKGGLGGIDAGEPLSLVK